MATSLPMIRFGMAMGINAPWTMPQRKPAGSCWRAKYISARFNVQPMTNPSTASVSSRFNIFTNIGCRARFSCVANPFIISKRTMLREGAIEPEHFDDPARTREEITDGYRELARVNRLFRLEDPYTRVMSRWLGPKNCTNLSILDLGAGDGWLGNVLEEWAKKQGWTWRVTNLDINAVALGLRPAANNVVGSVLALPFQANTFDIVIASQMTHHLASDDDVVQHFREAYRVARQGVFITDMKRNAFLYTVLWIVLRILRLKPEMRNDGLLSVKRSWRHHEFVNLAARAQLTG